jgi:pyrophosphatase PpaX
VRFPVCLFDLDGTLIDSGPMIVASMKHAAKTVLDRDIPEAVLTAAVGGPGLTAQMHALDPERVDELVAAYREHNEPLHEELEAFWEVVEVLPRLRSEGRRLGIVTAKRHATVQLAFDRLPGLESNFDVVVGSEDTERHKPDPDPILEALRRLGATSEDAAYVGDSPFDVRAAKAAGVCAVAVAWGGIHGAEALEREEPDVLVRHAEELLGVL